MKKISTYLLGFSLVLAAAGCGKEKDPEPNVSAKTKLLTTPQWRISAVVATTTVAGQTTTTDAYFKIPSCKRDDFSKFNSNLTVVVDEGATRCSTTDPQSKQGTWAFNTDETQLTVVDPSVPVGSPGNTATAEILQLSATTLQVKTTNTQTISGFTFVTTATTTYTPI